MGCLRKVGLKKDWLPTSIHGMQEVLDAARMMAWQGALFLSFGCGRKQLLASRDRISKIELPAYLSDVGADYLRKGSKHCEIM